MIYGKLSNWQRDKNLYPAIFDLAFSFLNQKDPLSLTDGDYPIDGKHVFARVQSLTTSPEKERLFESHAKYTDLQLLLSGREKQLFLPDTADLTLTEDNLTTNDVAFYAHPDEYNSLFLTPGCYAVYFAGEAHCPNCSISVTNNAIRKIVFKFLWAESE